MSKNSFNFIVEYFVIKNPAEKAPKVRITEYGYSFRELGITGNQKTQLFQLIKKRNRIVFSRIGQTDDLEKEASTICRTKNVVVAKNNYVSQIDELFRIVRNGLAHGHFEIYNNRLICKSFNSRGLMNGFVSLSFNTYNDIIKLVFKK